MSWLGVLAAGAPQTPDHVPLGSREPCLPAQWPHALSCRRSQVIEKFEALDTEKAEHMETNLSTGPSASSDTRQGRSEKRAFPRKRVSVRALGNTGAVQAVGTGGIWPPIQPIHMWVHFCPASCSCFLVVSCVSHLLP